MQLLSSFWVIHGPRPPLTYSFEAMFSDYRWLKHYRGTLQPS
jgi:hypothetical protein